MPWHPAEWTRCSALPELARGRLSLPVWRSYPLEDAAKAHADLDSHRNHGKLVLLP